MASLESMPPTRDIRLPSKLHPGPIVAVVAGLAQRFVANNWKVVMYVLLIVLCVLFAPEKPLHFIYTEF